MRASIRLIVMTLILGVGLGVASCDKSPTRPTPQSGTTVTPTAVENRLEIAAPPTVDPGGSVQLKATLFKFDGSTQDVTGQVQWSTTNPAVVQVSAAGVASALTRGEAVINAFYGSPGATSATTRLMVLPSGTFRLTGQITNTGLPLDGVTVTVLEGTGEGLTSVTNASGAYALYGVAGRVRLHAKKDGFSNELEEVEVAEHQTLDFDMTFDGRRGSLSGRYTLELEVNSCLALTEDVRRRSYVADVEQHGSRLVVYLKGADFILVNGRGDHFAGLVDADGRISFAIGDAFYYYYYFIGNFDLIERLSSASALLVAGTVAAASTPSGIVGTLRGHVAQTQGVEAPFTKFSANCFSPAHGFEMRRQ